MSTPAQNSHLLVPDSDVPGKKRPFSILLVCTGNICRSPAAERLLISGLGNRDEITVSSAGLGAMVGQPIDGPMADLLVRRGVNAASFASRSITPRMIETADLILTMTRRQQSALLLLVPSAGRRTFLLRELATLFEEIDSPPAGEPTAFEPLAAREPSVAVEPSAARQPENFAAERLRAAIALAVAQRAARGAIRGLENFDIDDPYRQSDRVVASCFALIESSVDRLLRHVALEVGVGTPDTAPQH